MVREHIPEAVKRAVVMRSHGRCEYACCSRIVANITEDYRVVVSGQMAHILPASDDGPRSEFSTAHDVDRSSAENIILLCRDHHDEIDFRKRNEHPPAILFAMAERKNKEIDFAIDEFLISSPSRYGYKELLEDIRVGRVFTLMNEFYSSGPRHGHHFLISAENY